MSTKIMDNFQAVYKILSTIEVAMNYPQFDTSKINAENFNEGNIMKKQIFKISAIIAFIVDIMLFLPNVAINRTDFCDSATEMIWYYWIAYILFGVVLIFVVVDIVKEKSKKNIIFGLIMIILSFFIAFIVYKHHTIIEFYDSPVSDLPWDYHKI